MKQNGDETCPFLWVINTWSQLDNLIYMLLIPGHNFIFRCHLLFTCGHIVFIFFTNVNSRAPYYIYMIFCALGPFQTFLAPAPRTSWARLCWNTAWLNLFHMNTLRCQRSKKKLIYEARHFTWRCVNYIPINTVCKVLTVTPYSGTAEPRDR